MVVGEFSQEADVVIVGGGPGGYTAAFRAAELGQKVTLVDERPTLGGVCLHEGCIPSKALLALAERISAAAECGPLGVLFGRPTVDADAVRGWLDRCVDTLAKGLEGQCRKRRVEYIQGRARFADGRNLDVTDGPVPRLRFRRAVIAAGATTMPHTVLSPDLPGVLTAHEAVRLPSLPKSLLVIGDGYIAVEIASAFAALGSAVTLAYEGPMLLPEADADLARPLMRVLERRLQQIAAGVEIIAAEPSRSGVTLRFAEGKGLGGADGKTDATFENIILAGALQPNTASLRLDRTGVKTDDAGFIAVNEECRTSDPRIFAVGDVTGGPLLADKALHQGRVCAEVIAGWKSAFEPQAVPFVAFTDPNVAWCGLTEQAAKRAGREVAVRRIPWGASGRAVSMGRTEGVTKLIFDPDTKLVLGVGIAGPHAAEMIAEGALAIEMGAVLDDLAATVHPHPSVSELLADASQQALGVEA